MLITETQAYIKTKPVKSLDDAFEDPAFRLECPCKIPPKTGALVYKCRCMIPVGWEVQFSIEFDDDIFTEVALTTALETAGRLCGIGGWRPKFGRFLVEVL